MNISRRTFLTGTAAAVCGSSLAGLTSCNNADTEIKSENIKAISNVNYLQRDVQNLDNYNFDVMQSANKFLSSFPNYRPTPLVSLNNLSKKLGVSNIYVKDESQRFVLNAFKVCGASFAMGKYIADKIGKNIQDVNYDEIASADVRQKLGQVCFVTATDGNHGRAVAWTANKLGQKSVVYMPKGSSQERLNNILAEDAQAEITPLTYDDSVRLAETNAKKYGWVLVQDTAWEGYVDIPTWIMQGYTNMFFEIVEQLKNFEITHVFLQAGVGSFSAAISAAIVNYCRDKAIQIPKIVIVEPFTSDCIYKTAFANNGQLQNVKDDMTSIMAGLNCGEPNLLAWDILNTYSYRFCSISDEIAKIGMRILAKPLADDQKITSGESGACTLGLVYEVLNNKNLNQIKENLELTSGSKILCISTEGDTDKNSYNNIVNM